MNSSIATNTMTNMAAVNTQSLRVAPLFQQYRSLVADYVSPERVEQLADAVHQNTLNAQPTVMMYGLYSAGKSALINALLGTNAAIEGRNPTTDCVQQYQWMELDIHDTPGVDAPKEHEQVTLQQLEHSDLVIFVVSASAALDDRHTYENVIKLVARKRKVMLAVNWRREQVTVEERMATNNGLRQQLQRQAAELGLEDGVLLSQIPIHWINAKMGLQGKMGNKQALLSQSGLPEFEDALYRFIAETDQHQQERRLASDLVQLCQEAQQGIEHRLSALGAAGHQQLANRLQQEHTRLRTLLYSAVRQQHLTLSSTYQQLALNHTDPVASEQQLVALLERCSRELEQQLQQEVNHTSDRLEALAVELDQQRAAFFADIDIPSAHVTPVNSLGEEGLEKSLPSLMPEVNFQTLMQQIKSEHLVGIMKWGKTVLPSLFKGIGPKTMAKWAESVLNKTRMSMPWLQMGVQVLVGAWQYYQAEKEQREQREAEARFHEEVRSGAEQFGRQYQQSMEAALDDMLTAVLSPAREAIENNMMVCDQQQKSLVDANRDLSQLIDFLKRTFN